MYQSRTEEVVERGPNYLFQEPRSAHRPRNERHCCV